MARQRGSIREKTPGRWHWYVTVPDASKPSGKRQLSKGPYATRTAAAKALTKALAEQDAGRLAIGEQATMPLAAYALEVWLPGIAATRRTTTTATARTMLRRFVEPFPLGRVALRDIRRADLAAWVAAVRGTVKADGQPVGQASVTGAYRTVRAVLRYAADHEVIATAPALPRSTAPTPGNGRSTVEPWDAASAARWLTAVDDHPLGLGLRVIASTGLRRGELLGLRWSDVDLDTGRIDIRRTVIVADGRIVESEPKTARSRRSLVLDEDLRGRLRRHQIAQREHALEHGLRWTASVPVLASPTFEPTSPHALTRAQREVCATAGVPPRTVHDLRHLAAHDLILSGVPLTAVSKLLGHSSIAITADRYGHLQADDDALERLAAYRAAR